MIDVVLADDHPVVRAGLRAVIETDPPRMSLRAADGDPRLSGTPDAVAAARGTTP